MQKKMLTVDFETGTIQVDARIVGDGFGIEPSLVLAQMREGKITSVCERGIDEDHGRYRLTFLSKSRRFRIVADEVGNVLRRSSIDFSGRPLPHRSAKPGA